MKQDLDMKSDWRLCKKLVFLEVFIEETPMATCTDDLKALNQRLQEDEDFFLSYVSKKVVRLLKLAFWLLHFLLQSTLSIRSFISLSLKGSFTNFEYITFFLCLNKRNIYYERYISIKQLWLEIIEKNGAQSQSVLYL